MVLPSNLLPIVYIDGRFVSAPQAQISVFDGAYLYGDGVFETVHIFEGEPVALDRHIARLENSARFSRLHSPLTTDATIALIRKLLVRNGLTGPNAPEAALRLTLSAAAHGGVTVSAYLRALSPEHLAKRDQGVLTYTIALTLGDQRLAQHKTTSRAATAIGRRMLRERSRHPRAEGLLCGPDDELLEALTANIFLVENGTIATPSVERGVLPGTSRAIVLDLARHGGYTIKEERVDLTRLRSADEVFVTSSTLHVAPVIAFEDEAVGGGTRGPVVRDLQNRFAAWLRAEKTRLGAVGSE